MSFKNQWTQTVYDILRAHEVMGGWVDEYVWKVASEAYDVKLERSGGIEAEMDDPVLVGKDELQDWIDCA